MGSPEDTGVSGFTTKSVLIAILLSVFLVASSSYIALKLGAMPWPIIFSVVIAAGIVRLVSRKVNPHEINVAQAGGSIGGMLATALVFTVPAIWFLQRTNPELQAPSIWVIIAVTLIGGVLGIVLSIPIRRIFIDEENLSYPSGTAGAELINTGQKGGPLFKVVIISALLTAIFVALRQLYFAGGWTISALAGIGITIFILPMPLAIGVGYIVGRKASYSWFFGALLGWVFMIPYLVVNRMPLDQAAELVRNTGMGIVLGAGVGFFLTYTVSKFKKIFAPLFNSREKWYFRSAPYLSVLSIILLYLVGVPILASLIAVVGVWIMVAIAARMTGETDIDPLEQFGIIVGLIAVMVYSVFALELGIFPALLIIVFVSVASSIAGDIGQDFKSAKVVGTKVKDIIKVDLIAVVVASFVGPFVLMMIKDTFADVLFEHEMSALQSTLVAGSLSGFGFPQFFIAGMIFAIFYEFVNKWVHRKYKEPLPMSAMPFGIGMFIGLPLSLLIFAGGLIREAFDRKSKYVYAGIVIAAGVMAGESIVGFGGPVLTEIAKLSPAYVYFSALGISFLLLIMMLLYNPGKKISSGRSRK